MLIIDFKILGKKWKLRILKKKKYVKKNGNDSVAMAYLYKRAIDIHPNGVDLETLIHELVHAYMSEMCVKSTTDMTADDTEELFAELMSKRGRELLDLADELFKQINEATSAQVTLIRNVVDK